MGRAAKRRSDFPTEPSLKRANMQAALAAARPENRKQALAELDSDVLASTTMSSNAPRVCFYQEICRAWETDAWPLCATNIRGFGACLKAGSYKRVGVYFSGITGHGFQIENPSPMADAMLICAWWMLREIESSNAQVGHFSINERLAEVTLTLPVQKTDTRGLTCSRTLGR